MASVFESPPCWFCHVYCQPNELSHISIESLLCRPTPARKRVRPLPTPPPNRRSFSDGDLDWRISHKINAREKKIRSSSNLGDGWINKGERQPSSATWLITWNWRRSGITGILQNFLLNQATNRFYDCSKTLLRDGLSLAWISKHYRSYNITYRQLIYGRFVQHKRFGM